MSEGGVHLAFMVVAEMGLALGLATVFGSDFCSPETVITGLVPGMTISKSILETGA